MFMLPDPRFDCLSAVTVAPRATPVKRAAGRAACASQNSIDADLSGPFLSWASGHIGRWWRERRAGLIGGLGRSRGTSFADRVTFARA
jgi:hypothetical protein